MENKEEIFQEKILNAKSYEELDEKDFLFSIKEKLQKLGDFTLIKNEDNIESRKAYYEVIPNIDEKVKYTYINPKSNKEEQGNDIQKLFQEEVIDSLKYLHNSYTIYHNEEPIAICGTRLVKDKKNPKKVVTNTNEIYFRAIKKYEKIGLFSAFFPNAIDASYCRNKKLRYTVAECNPVKNPNFPMLERKLIFDNRMTKLQRNPDGYIPFITDKKKAFDFLQLRAKYNSINTDLPITYLDSLKTELSAKI